MSTSKAAPPERTRSAARKKPSASPPAEKPERFVILLRHGIAEDRTPDKKDEERGLTAEGHARMKQIARGLERSLPRIQAIYSSPLLRTIQTGLWVSRAYRSRVSVTASDALAPGATSEQFLELMRSIDVRRAIVVGHEPSLTNGLRALVHLSDPSSLELKKGGCFGVRILSDGSALLEWILPPRILRKLGE